MPTSMTAGHLRRLLSDLNFLIPRIPAPRLKLICLALHIIIIAGVKDSGVRVESGQEAIDILDAVAKNRMPQKEALRDLQTLQKGD